MNLGWSCMSCRQPESPSPRTKSAASTGSVKRFCAEALMRHLRDLQRMESLKKMPGLVQLEIGVLRFNAQKEPVTAGPDEIWGVKHRMIRLRQPIERNHAKYRGQCSAQNSAFKSHRNKRRPGVKWLAAHVDGIVHRGNPILKGITADHAQHGAAERQQRHTIMVDSNGLRRFFQRIRRIAIHLAVSSLVGRFGRMHQVSWSIELRHQSVNGKGSRCLHSFTFAWGSRVRISKMEMAGMNRMNRKNNKVKKPMVPMKIIRSHLVNQYIPQELGRKSRCRLVTTITKRSSRIPVLTTRATQKSFQGVERTLLNHSNCGIAILQRINIQ